MVRDREFQKGAKVKFCVELDAHPEREGVGRIVKRRVVVDGDVCYYMYDIKVESGTVRRFKNGQWQSPTPFRKGEMTSALEFEVEKA